MQTTEHPVIGLVDKNIKSWRGMTSLHRKFPTEASVVDFVIRDYWNNSPETRSEFASEEVFGAYVRGARRQQTPRQQILEQQERLATATVDAMIENARAGGGSLDIISTTASEKWHSSENLRAVFPSEEAFCAYCRHEARERGITS